MKFVFVLGEGGAGKTTLCRAIVSDEALGEQIIVHSIGQELRRLALREPAIALSVENGLPVSDQVITNLLSKKIESDAVNIIDNYPQTGESLRYLIVQQTETGAKGYEPCLWTILCADADARDNSRIFDPDVLRSISKLEPSKTTNGDSVEPPFLEAT